MFVAYSFYVFQLLCLGQLCRLCTSKPPDFCISRIGWDETGEKIKAAGSVSSVWQVVVSRVRIVLGWVQLDGNPIIIDWTLIMPFILVPTSSAAAIYHGLYHSALTRPLMMGRYLLFQRAKYALDVSETDDATANSKLQAHMMFKYMNTPGVKAVMASHMICRLHQQQLIEILVMACAGTWLLARSFSFVLLLRSSGVFVRLVREFSHLTCSLVVRSGRPLEHIQLFLDEMKDYLLAEHRRFRQNVKTAHHWVQSVALELSDPEDEEPRRKYKEIVDDVFLCGLDHGGVGGIAFIIARAHIAASRV